MDRVKPGDRVQIGIGAPYTVSDSPFCPECGRMAFCKPHRYVWANWLNGFRAGYEPRASDRQAHLLPDTTIA